ncbi:MAG: iron donor protein CyaY [Legionellaceae bacterium]|nr:iron donor protein CyaY [Legionellaceae bacterium]
MNEAEFRKIFDQTLLDLEQTIEAADLAVDCEPEAGTLQLCFQDGIKWVITPQPPLKQLWFATHEQGYHFDHQDGRWVDNRSGETFAHLLNTVLSAQLHKKVELNFLH